MNGDMSVQQQTIPREIAVQAAEWFLLIHSEEATLDDTVACDTWRSRSVLHEQAWQRAQQLSKKFGLIPARLGGHVLKRPVRAERRQAVKTLAALLVAVPTAWTVYRNAPVWAADHRTAVGERRDIVLADGTQITLNTDTAVDVSYSDAQRLVVLRSGEVLIETARDLAGRPFLVSTESGLVRAIGTRFTVRQLENRTQVGVLDGAVELMPAGGGAKLRINKGEQAWFSRSDIGTVMALESGAGAWQRGVLAADDMRLANFLAELSRYRHGGLRCDPAIADLRVTGAFQLNDTDPILRSLPAVLPVEVVYRTRYWVAVVPRAA